MGGPLFLLLLTGVVAFAGLADIDAPLKTDARADSDAAVVIGVEDYFVLPPVPHARRDAEAFYRFLVYTRGVPASAVQLLDKGANREKILAAVRTAGAQASAGGTVWVYFAGHGAASPADGERLLLGDDARPDLDSFQARAVPVSALRELAAAGGADVNLVLDTCYTGADRSGGELIAGKRFAVPTYASKPTGKALEWTAASPGEWSGPLDEARHGAFTYFVVGALRGWADGQISGVRDGRVTAEEAGLYVSEALRAVQVRDQTPILTVATPRDRVLAEGVTEVGPSLDATRTLPPAVVATTTPAAPVPAPQAVVSIPEATSGPSEGGGATSASALLEDFLTNQMLMPRADRDRLLAAAQADRTAFVAGPEVAQARAELRALPSPEARLQAIADFSGQAGTLSKSWAVRAYGPLTDREKGKLGTTWFGPPPDGLGIRAVGVGFAASVIELRALPAVVDVLRGAGQSLVPIGLFGLSEREVRDLLGAPAADRSTGNGFYPSLEYSLGNVRVTTYLTGDGGEVHAVTVNYPED